MCESVNAQTLFMVRVRFRYFVFKANTKKCHSVAFQTEMRFICGIHTVDRIITDVECHAGFSTIARFITDLGTWTTSGPRR